MSCQVPWDYYIFFSSLASWRLLKSKELVFLQSWQESKACAHIEKVKISHKNKVVFLFHLVLTAAPWG